MGGVFSSQENELDTFEDSGLIYEPYSDNELTVNEVYILNSDNELTVNEVYILNLLLYIDTNNIRIMN